MSFIIQDGEVPSTYFSYFWVELEDPSRFPDSPTTILQVPVPKVERKRPGGIGIADLQPFIRPPPEAQEETHEWTGVTERMVDEVDESKRTNKVYDLRIETSCKRLFCMMSAQEPSESSLIYTGVPTKPLQTLDVKSYFFLTKAFMEWGGFASSPAQKSGDTGPSTRPTFDRLTERASQVIKTESPPTLKEGKAPPAEQESHKPFNHEFDEPVHSTNTQMSAVENATETPSEKSQSLLAMQREGKRLSRKQRALLQAAAISRTPLPKPEEKAKEKEEREAAEGGAAPEEERKQIQSRVWNLIKNKWF